jgi:hypothetical protein
MGFGIDVIATRPQFYAVGPSTMLQNDASKRRKSAMI